jgi:apolipoprotein N-acyltransferase
VEPRATVPAPLTSDPRALALSNRNRRRATATRPVAAALAVGGGLLVYAALSWTAAWPAAIAGAAAVTAATRGHSARFGALLGLLAGLATFAPLLWWLHVVGYDAWLVLAVLEAALLVPLGAALAVVHRVSGWPLWTATLWVAEEAWRDRLPFGGFPWGRLAFSQPSSWLTPYAAVGGAPLLSFAVALGASALVAVAVALARGRRGRAAVAAGGVLAVLLLGFAVPVATGGQAGSAGPAHAVVAAVQGNVPHPGLHFLGRPEQVLGNHVAETARLADLVASGRVQHPDAVIWPENSSDLDPFRVPAAAQLITHAVDGIGVPTLVGAVVDDPRDDALVDNEGIVWTPGVGPGATYVKQHPVPFGEYIPFRSVLTKLIGRFSLVPKDFAHGHHNGLLQLGPVRIGDVICFEIAYDGIVRHTVTAGGRLIVVQTNNATYARTAESDQQLAISRVRAVEHGRAVIIAATSGISAVIAPDGRVLQRTRELVPAVLVADVPLRDSETVADRLGPAPEIALCAIAGIALAASLVLRRWGLLR